MELDLRAKYGKYFLKIFLWTISVRPRVFRFKSYVYKTKTFLNFQVCIRLLPEKRIKLCLKNYIFRSYHFLAEVAFETFVPEYCRKIPYL